MTDTHKISLVEQLTALESAYRGLAEASAFDEQLAVTRKYVTDKIAELIFSDELVDEIEGCLSGMAQALAAQTVNELCNDVFGSTDYVCAWTVNRQWLGDAIVVSSMRS